MTISPLAGTLPQPSTLVNVPRLITAYYAETPDPAIAAERVAFGTSGHRGSAFRRAFNETHILAITRAIAEYRKAQGTTGPLFLGMDTHPLSEPAVVTALEVLAAEGVEVMISEADEYTPTPALSRAILAYNRARRAGLADGIVITPSHNPPEDGGFKYNPPHGGPAGTDATKWIEDRANALIADGLDRIRRMDYGRALAAPTTHRYDFLNSYVEDLSNVVDTDVIRDSGVRFGVDPLGGAGVHYWGAIANRYNLPLEVVSDRVDPTFSFMTLDWDGKIRMDPSSPYTMQALIANRERFDVAFACDTDHDRHGIVTRGAGLLQPNHYLSTAIAYLFSHRPGWKTDAAVGKTLVSSGMIDRVTRKLGRRLHETPVGFKWFVDGLLDGSLGFGGEESAGAAFLRTDGTVWTTDKDGLILGLLAAEMTARTGRDPSELYGDLTAEFGEPVYDRIEGPASPEQKKRLSRLSPDQVRAKTLAGDVITAVLTHAPGNGAAIGGLKVVTASGWFAARPSGTEDIYKIYAESFVDEAHLRRIQDEARSIVSETLEAGG